MGLLCFGEMQGHEQVVREDGLRMPLGISGIRRMKKFRSTTKIKAHQSIIRFL